MNVRRVAGSFREAVRDGTVRRFLFVSAVAFWLGGFTFYAGVVIHVGGRVLGSHVRQGFITQQVTNWLNLAGVVALAVMLWNAASVWSTRGRARRRALALSWLVMTLVQVALLGIHPMMDRLLDASGRQVLDDDHFGRLHFAYVAGSTLQWAAGLVHVFCAVAGSRS